jgi:hypothetical protein
MSPRALVVVAVLVAATGASADRRKPAYSFGGLGGYTLGTILARDVSGPSVAGYGVLRFGVLSVGVRVSIASLDGTYDITSRRVNIAATPVSAGFYLQVTGLDRLWAGASAGVDFMEITDDTSPSAFKIGFNIGADAGIDVVRIGKHRVVLFGRVETELASSAEYRALSFGAGYRLY